MGIFNNLFKKSNDQNINETTTDGLDLKEDVQDTNDGVTTTDNDGTNATGDNETLHASNEQCTNEEAGRVDKVSGHSMDDLNYFNDTSTDLKSTMTHLTERFADAGYHVTVDGKTDFNNDTYYHMHISKEDKDPNVFVEVNADLAAAVRVNGDEISHTAFDPTNDDEITNIIKNWR